MADESPKSVLCAERVKINAFAGVLFLVGGDGIILVSVFNDTPGSWGSYLTIAFGIVAILIGFYYLLCYINKRVFVSEEGVTYTNWMGKSTQYSWDQVSISFHQGRNAYFTFHLNGKDVKFYGYAYNAQALYDYLIEHERFDADSMRAHEKAKEAYEEHIRAMQKKARTNEFADDDDFDDDDFE